MSNHSLSISSNRFSRDLLQRFMGSTNSSGNDANAMKEEEDEEIELNLGLSLGGRFGVDRKSSYDLGRSSSIASCLPVVRDDNDLPQPVSYSGLTRTSSLPVENEEEWRKRKELQTLRRMAAKRRRYEKHRNLKGDKQVGDGRLTVEERKEIEFKLRGRSVKQSLESQLPPLGKGKGSYVGKSGGMQGFGQPESVEAEGIISSSSVDLESKALQGSTGELTTQTSLEETNQDIGPCGTRTTENTSTALRSETKSQSKKPDTSGSPGKEAGANSMDMPSVFTKGDGPNGKRVDGILYKYGEGAEVKIMCVCHGSFHSPSEFVRHAGGSDVDHPLKHIVINPYSSSLL